MLMGNVYNNAVSYNDSIKEEGWRCIQVDYLYSIETKLVLFTVGYHKILILILKVNTKKKTKSIQKGKEEAN